MTQRNITILAITFLAFVVLTQAVSIQHKLHGHTTDGDECRSSHDEGRGSHDARHWKSPRGSPLNIDFDCRGVRDEHRERCESLCDAVEQLERKIDHVCNDFTVASLVKKCDCLLTKNIADLYNTNSAWYNRAAVANQVWDLAGQAWICQGVRNNNCKQCAQAGGALCTNMGQFQGLVDKINFVGKLLSKAGRDIHDKCGWAAEDLLSDIENDLNLVLKNFNAYKLGQIYDRIDELSSEIEYGLRLYEDADCEDNAREIKHIWKEVKDFDIIPGTHCVIDVNFDFSKFVIRGIDKLDQCLNHFWPKK